MTEEVVGPALGALATVVAATVAGVFAVRNRRDPLDRLQQAMDLSARLTPQYQAVWNPMIAQMVKDLVRDPLGRRLNTSASALATINVPVGIGQLYVTEPLKGILIPATWILVVVSIAMFVLSTIVDRIESRRINGLINRVPVASPPAEESTTGDHSDADEP